MVEPAEAVVRLVIVFLLAFGIGLERQLRRKPVGFGTFVFVSTGACALAILSVDLEDQNPLPLLGGVITGIGFLGAGALIRSNDRVFGFTTAALVWAMAALGVTAGAGLYYLAFVNLEIGPQGLQLFPVRVPVGLPREDLLELDELPESPHGVEVHLDSLEPVDLAGLADLGLHREDAGQDLADRRCVRDRCKEDPTLLHAADVGPLVVDELTLPSSLDRSELEAPFPQAEVRVALARGGAMFRSREKGPSLAQVLVPGLELDEVFLSRIHASGDERGPQEDCRRRPLRRSPCFRTGLVAVRTST